MDPNQPRLDPVFDDEGDSLDSTDRAALDAAIASAWHLVPDGRGRGASDVLADLRARP